MLTYGILMDAIIIRHVFTNRIMCSSYVGYKENPVSYCYNVSFPLQNLYSKLKWKFLFRKN